MKYCSFCDYKGYIINPDAYEIGEIPLLPCPKCVVPLCKCNNEAPYLYSDAENVLICSCSPVRTRIDKILSLYGKCDLEKKYRWRFLSDFNCRTQAETKAKTIAYKIMHEFPAIDRGLFIWGNPGTGKTLLSAITLTELITRHAVEGKYVKISKSFFGKLRSTFVEGSALYGMSAEIEKQLQEIDVLVIDDFGTQRDSAWEKETLYNLVDSRYEAEKFTIFTSNSNPLITLKEHSDGRILSRIREMCRIIELSGPDRREELGE
jgi:DNA replication protein DnaC